MNSTQTEKYSIEFVTISGIPKDDFEDVKKKLAETLKTDSRYLTNKDVVFILMRFFTYWFDNISSKDAFEIRDIVEKLVALKKADKGTYERTCSRFRRFLDGLMGVFEDMDYLVSSLFGEAIQEYAESRTIKEEEEE